jgi:hypothetical protein
VILEG